MKTNSCTVSFCLPGGWAQISWNQERNQLYNNTENLNRLAAALVTRITLGNRPPSSRLSCPLQISLTEIKHNQIAWEQFDACQELGFNQLVHLHQY